MEAWFLHAVGDGSLVLARCRRWKPGSCTLSAMEAWFLHAADDGSLVLARCRRWKLDHQVLLLDTMVVVTRGILPGDPPSAAAAGDHGGRHSWDPPRPSSSHGGRRHRELDHKVLLDTMAAVTRGIHPSPRAPTVVGGIELDHQVLLLLDTPVVGFLLPVS
jgi:hypothetical protein